MRSKAILLATTTLIFLIYSPLSFGSNSQIINQNDVEEEVIFNRLYISLNGAVNLTIFSNNTVNSNNEWEKLNKLNVMPSFDVSYLLTPNLGFGLGIRLGRYTSAYQVNNLSVQLERSFIDQDNDEYFPIYENVNLEELTSYSSFDIPLFFKYQNSFGSDKLTYYASMGVVFSSYSKVKFTLNGDFTRKGYYPAYNVVLNDYPEYNFDDLTYTTDSELELGSPKNQVSGLISLGIMYNATNDIMIKAGFSGMLGLTGVEPITPDSFNHFHSSLIVGKSYINSLGFELGLVYRFLNK